MNATKSSVKLLLILLLLTPFKELVSQNKKIFKIEIREEIAPPVWRSFKKAMDNAKLANATSILIHINTYGGQVDMADSIRTLILNSKIPVYAFIDNNAASAGALISIACDSIYMKKDATIGAASVVNAEGTIMPEKYQSYMRGIMRATAEASGRNPQIAEAMVDPRVIVEGLVDSTKIVTFTSSEAVRFNFCNGIANNFEEIKALTGNENAVIESAQFSTIDKIIHFLINPAVSGILLLVIFLGIYYEMQSPGIGFALLAAAIASVLYFAPLYLEGLAENWEILVAFVGLILIGVEVFVVPGFGITGISGISLFIIGLVLSLISNRSFDFSMTGDKEIATALLVVFIPIGVALSLFFVLGDKIVETKWFKRVSLQTTENAEEGYVVSMNNDTLIGKVGIAHTDLKLSGKVKIENEVYEALSEFSFISKGEKVRITRTERHLLIVQKIA